MSILRAFIHMFEQFFRPAYMPQIQGMDLRIARSGSSSVARDKRRAKKARNRRRARRG